LQAIQEELEFTSSLRKKMASGFFQEEDFLCPICYDIFKDPVVLPCSHSVILKFKSLPLLTRSLYVRSCLDLM
uniref:Zinc finger RING-type eukaryotic domain-containing protein n=1 Tax=Esox lucius TaxID=8010 RepID=A0A3P8Z1Z6_ESOLU